MDSKGESRPGFAKSMLVMQRFVIFGSLCNGPSARSTVIFLNFCWLQISSRNDGEVGNCHHSLCEDTQSPSFVSPSRCWKSVSGSHYRRTLRHCSRSEAAAPSLNLVSASHSFLREAPDEILEIILLYSVQGHCDLRRLALTCKRWRVFTQEDQPWKRLFVRAWGNRNDIVQVPIKRESTSTPWRVYYISRIHAHLPEVNYMIRQQYITVSIR
jgi:hypothetical protein